MKLQTLIQTGFGILEATLPALAGHWATKLFLRPLRFKRPSREQVWLKGAMVEQVPLAGFYRRPAAESYYTAYRWGRGPAVLLAHGWGGRGSQLGYLVPPLLEAGFQVVAFDAFAHGDSPGRQTNILEIGQIIADLAERSAGFEAIIGHSFGGLVAAYALSQGVPAQKLITISSPASMDYIFAQYARQINISAGSLTKIKGHIETLTGRDADDFSLINLVQQFSIPGLIIHDEQDREVDCQQAHLLTDHWPGSRLHLTQGLGHYRILRDAAVRDTISQFVLAEAESAGPVWPVEAAQPI